jgi:hypothetical protein
MGIYFRKRKSLFGNLLNFSLTGAGLGVSLGVRGLCVGLTAWHRFVPKTLFSSSCRYSAALVSCASVGDSASGAIPASAARHCLCAGLLIRMAADSLAYRGDRVVGATLIGPRAELGVAADMPSENAPRSVRLRRGRNQWLTPGSQSHQLMG